MVELILSSSEFHPGSIAWPIENWSHRVWGPGKSSIIQLFRIQPSIFEFARDGAAPTTAGIWLSGLRAAK